jgi:hypothetical protein
MKKLIAVATLPLLLGGCASASAAPAPSVKATLTASHGKPATFCSKFHKNRKVHGKCLPQSWIPFGQGTTDPGSIPDPLYTPAP